MSKKLSNLLCDIEYTGWSGGDASIDNICYDSRFADNGSFFFCLVGASNDGHSFALAAYDRGCRVFALEYDVELPCDAVKVFFENTRRGLSYVSQSFFDYPARKMKIVGITGTKGKTSVATMLKTCLEDAGISAGYIGTSGIDYGTKHFYTKNTTPESYELHRTFRDMLECGVENVIIEVSSQALFNYRVEGIKFFASVFTNLSPDHIGPSEHPNFEHYKNCKRRLFSLCENAVFNVDDEYYPDMREGASCRCITYGIENKADFSAKNIREAGGKRRLSVDFEAVTPAGSNTVSLPVPGRFSVMNALAVMAVAGLFDVDIEKIARALEKIKIAGRFETVELFSDRTFVIDYAHNEVSMRTLLETVRGYNPERIVCLYGSVGERTKNRRRELALVARDLADFSVITADNPGSENPEGIAREIASFYDDENKYIIIPDRETAIRYAVENSCPGDIVLLCGKGHENYQLIGREKVPFCERDILLSYKK